MLDRSFNGGAATLDCVLHSAWHQAPPTLPSPKTGSIITFIESALGCEATSIAATACSSAKRCDISCVRSKPLRYPPNTSSVTSCRMPNEDEYDPIRVFSSMQTAPGSKVASPCC